MGVEQESRIEEQYEKVCTIGNGVHDWTNPRGISNRVREHGHRTIGKRSARLDGCRGFVVFRAGLERAAERIRRPHRSSRMTAVICPPLGPPVNGGRLRMEREAGPHPDPLPGGEGVAGVEQVSN